MKSRTDYCNFNLGNQESGHTKEWDPVDEALGGTLHRVRAECGIIVSILRQFREQRFALSLLHKVQRK